MGQSIASTALGGVLIAAWVCACGATTRPPAPAAAMPEPSGPKAPGSSGAEAPDLSRLWAEVDEVVARQVVVGASAAVILDGTLHTHVAGRAALDGGPALAPATWFRLGSVTKLVTALAVWQQLERGNLSLASRVDGVLPDYAGSGRAATVEQLLRHTSGIADFADALEADPEGLEQRRLTQAELTALFEDAPPLFPPGSAWAYSNSNFVLLARMVERASGRAFEAYVREQVLTPAGVADQVDWCTTHPAGANGYAHDDSGFEPASPIDSGFEPASPIDSGFEPASPIDSGFEPASPIDMHNPGAAGGLCGTATGVALLLRALSSSPLVGDAMRAAALSPQVLSGGLVTGWGLGVTLCQLGPARCFGHAGGIRGFTAMALHVPDLDATLVVLANTEAPEVMQLPRRMAADLMARHALAKGPSPDAEAKATAPEPGATPAWLGDYRLLGRMPSKVARSADGIRAQLGRDTVRLPVVGPGYACSEPTCAALQLTFLCDPQGRPRGYWLMKDGITLGANTDESDGPLPVAPCQP